MEWGRIVARAWQNKKFKKRLQSNPKKAIRKAFPNLRFTNVLRLPDRPADLSDDDLKQIVQGKCKSFVASTSNGSC